MGDGCQHKMNVTSWQTVAVYSQWNVMQRKQCIETQSDANNHGQRLLSLTSVQLSV